LGSAAVLDSSAILAVLFSEPGSDVVVPLLDGAMVSAVSLAEVHGSLLRHGAKADFAWNRIGELGCEVCPFDEEQARVAGELLIRAELSAGDRACLALAIDRKATVYTTDRRWKNLELGIEVEVIR
jgi:PIN domain nuclease of toxin-antitoxin system